MKIFTIKQSTAVYTSIKVALAIGHWAFGHTEHNAMFASVTAKQ